MDEHLDRLQRAADAHHAAAAAEEVARKALYSIIREVSSPPGSRKSGLVKQADIVRITGWTREHIRKIVDPSKKVGGTAE